MILLALDLSSTRSGWAKFLDNGDLLAHGQITPDKDTHIFLKIQYTVAQLVPLMMDADELVVEGIFLNTYKSGKHGVTGFELLARVSGAVINKWLELKTKVPVLYKAVEARKLVGVSGSSQKAEIQLWSIRKFNLLANSTLHPDLEDYDALIDAEHARLNAGEFKHVTFKVHMGHVSEIIEEGTGIGEDCADACLLGLAYLNDSRNKNV
jgi:hypothetical protein